MRRNFRNTFWNMTDTILYPVVALGITPFFLTHLGEKMFGIYMLSFSILFSLQVLNLGLGTATLRNVARCLGSGDFEGVNHTINANVSFSFILFCICALAGGVIASLVRYAGLFGIEPALKTYTAECIFLASLIGGVKFCEQIIQACFKGLERFDVAAWFNMSVRVGILIVNIISVWAFQLSVLGMLTLNLTITVTILLLQFRGFKYLFAHYHFFPLFTKNRIWQELNFGVWIWLQSLVLIVTYQTDRYVVTYIGLETLSYYGLTATIFNHVYLILGSLFPWLFPRIAVMKSRNEDAEPLFRTVRSTVAAFGIISLAVFFLVREPLLTLWIGHEKFLKLDQFIPPFIGFEMFVILTIVPGAFLNSAGYEKPWFYVNAIYSLVTILAIFAGYFICHSAQGIIAGLIAGAAISTPVMQYLTYNISPDSNFIEEVFLTSLPSIAGLLLVFSQGWMAHLFYFALMLITLRLVYFSARNFDFQWLRH
jgi:O-antigen/teichoic acid export membrane protein